MYGQLESTVTVYFTQISLYVNIYVVIYLPNNVLETGTGAVFKRELVPGLTNVKSNREDRREQYEGL